MSINFNVVAIYVHAELKHIPVAYWFLSLACHSALNYRALQFWTLNVCQELLYILQTSQRIFLIALRGRYHVYLHFTEENPETHNVESDSKWLSF